MLFGKKRNIAFNFLLIELLNEAILQYMGYVYIER